MDFVIGLWDVSVKISNMRILGLLPILLLLSAPFSTAQDSKSKSLTYGAINGYCVPLSMNLHRLLNWFRYYEGLHK